MKRKTVLHYEIQERLGEGLVGESYLGLDAQQGGLVTIKILAAPIQRNPSARALFLRHARASEKLDHPAICGIFQIGTERGQTFVVSQYAEGVSLAARLSEGSIPVAEALPLAAQVAEALAHGHGKGVVHEDLKPSNIILGADRVRVTDFGLIKGIPTLEYIHTKQHDDRLAVSTLAYMSPEQLRVHHLDARSDIFSLGAVLYEMIAGFNPFKRDSFRETVDSVLNEPAPPLASQVPGLPESLDLLVSRCLAKEVGGRPSSADAFRDELLNLKVV